MEKVTLIFLASAGAAIAFGTAVDRLYTKKQKTRFHEFHIRGWLWIDARETRNFPVDAAKIGLNFLGKDFQTERRWLLRLSAGVGISLILTLVSYLIADVCADAIDQNQINGILLQLRDIPEIGQSDVFSNAMAQFDSRKVDTPTLPFFVINLVFDFLSISLALKLLEAIVIGPSARSFVLAPIFLFATLTLWVGCFWLGAFAHSHAKSSGLSMTYGDTLPSQNFNNMVDGLEMGIGPTRIEESLDGGGKKIEVSSPVMTIRTKPGILLSEAPLVLFAIVTKGSASIHRPILYLWSLPPEFSGSNMSFDEWAESDDFEKAVDTKYLTLREALPAGTTMILFSFFLLIIILLAVSHSLLRAYRVYSF